MSVFQEEGRRDAYGVRWRPASAYGDAALLGDAAEGHQRRARRCEVTRPTGDGTCEGAQVACTIGSTVLVLEPK